MKDYMIRFIRNYQFFGYGVLEAMTEYEVRGIYETVIDWANI